MIRLDDYAAYRMLVSQVQAAEASMLPHALEVTRAWAQENTDNIVFTANVVQFTVGEGSCQEDCTMPIVVLLDPNWKEYIADHHRKKAMANLEWQRRCDWKNAQDLEAKEREELARLIEKYGVPRRG